MVWRTFSSFDDLRSDIILSYATDSASEISSDELVPENNIYFSPKLRQCYSYDSTVTIPSSNSIDEKLQLWYTSLAQGDVAVLGDISKIVPLSAKRFESIRYNEDSLRKVFQSLLCVAFYKFQNWFENRCKLDNDQSSYADEKRPSGNIRNCILPERWLHIERIHKKSNTQWRF